MALSEDFTKENATLGFSRTAVAMIVPVDYDNTDSWPGDYKVPYKFVFQFYPDTVNDSRGSEWTPINIPGGSHPLYQWTTGGERAIQFEAVFSLDSNLWDVNKAIVLENNKYYRDINATISALRWFTYPSYDSDNRVKSPSRLRLTLEGIAIGSNHSNTILAIMTDCTATISACFPDGTPRLARVSLSFKEIVQEPDTGISFFNRSKNMLPSILEGGLKNGIVGTTYMPVNLDIKTY